MNGDEGGADDSGDGRVGDAGTWDGRVGGRVLIPEGQRR